MKALSIKQPWAWAILCAGKDIENRSWYTNFRGRVLIHAGKVIDKSGIQWLREKYGIKSPDILLTGGIVGSVEIVDCVSNSKSDWFGDEWGFVLRNPEGLQFRPYRGQLGFFEVIA